MNIQSSQQPTKQPAKHTAALKKQKKWWGGKILFSISFPLQCRGGRAVFQFYPENARQIEMITSQSMRAGFTGGLVVDFPNSTKAKKYFLVLMTGGGNQARPHTNSELQR